LPAFLGGLVHLLSLAAMAQTPTASPSADLPAVQGFRKLAAADLKKGKELDDRFVKAAGDERWDDAIAEATELMAMYKRLCGTDHFEIVTNMWRIEDVRRLKAMRKDDLAEFRSTYAMISKALWLQRQGRHAEAQPLWEKALEIHRRLLSDDHPKTARHYLALAYNLWNQGKYGAAQPLFEKAVEMQRRLLGNDHPETAESYSGLANNLTAQKKYDAAQALFEKSLDIYRRFRGEEDSDTAASYNNLGLNLSARGQYDAAQPLFERALAIERRLRGDGDLKTSTNYNNVAANFCFQGKYAEAQPLYEKAVLIRRTTLGDNHPETASAYSNLAMNLQGQRKYRAAEPLLRKAVAINSRLLGDGHPSTTNTYNNLGLNLWAQGKFAEARDQWTHAARSYELGRVSSGHTGLDRSTASIGKIPMRHLAAVLAQLGQFAEAWQRLEEALGRGLLDELAARENDRLTTQERSQLSRLRGELERLDRFLEAPLAKLAGTERQKQLDVMREQRDRAQIALDELRAQLVRKYGPIAGQVASLAEIQPVLSADAALVTWVDIVPPGRSVDFSEHWGVVVRARGTPAWFRLPGTGDDGQWTDEDIKLAGRLREALRQRPLPGESAPGSLIGPLRAQRLDPLRAALKATTDGLPAVRRLIVLSSEFMSGVPLEVLVEPADSWTIGYAPSATVFAHLRRMPRIDTQGGLFALGDPAFERPLVSADPRRLPDHGLLAMVVVPGDNAARHGLKSGDVLLDYNRTALNSGDDLKVVTHGNQAVPIAVWRDGQVTQQELSAGELGIVFDSRTAGVALLDNRRLEQALTAARSRSEHFESLPGTRYEVQALSRLFASAHQPARILTDNDASEPRMYELAVSGDLGRFAFIHLATHGSIDERSPERSAVILTQTGLPDPLAQVLNKRPVYDGRLTAQEIERGWKLKAELVTLSACETARGQYVSGEGFVGFTQALLMSGARSVCLSLWKVDDVATALLMERFYANLLAARPGLSMPLPKAEALAEAKSWLRALHRDEIAELAVNLFGGDARSKDAPRRKPALPANSTPPSLDENHPYAHPYYWSAFVLVGNPD
jgi:CHAT domain-containing protein/tetratricopeptide (TPR) repeat protein